MIIICNLDYKKVTDFHKVKYSSLQLDKQNECIFVVPAIFYWSLSGISLSNIIIQWAKTLLDTWYSYIIILCTKSLSGSWYVLYFSVFVFVC